MKLSYLACPYNHPSDVVRQERYQAVTTVAAELMKNGSYIFSPVTHCHVMAMYAELPYSWDWWEGYDMLMISKCDELIVLKLEGWETSVGVSHEIAIAKELGLPISYIEEDDYDLHDWGRLEK